MANTDGLGGRYGAIYASFALLGMAVLFVLIVGAFAVLESLCIDDAVRVHGNPAPLELTGVPEEHIRVRLLDVGSDTRFKSSDLHVRLEDREFGLLIEKPVSTYIQTFNGDQVVLAKFPVPAIPGQHKARLTGTLFGSIQLEQEQPRSLEIPLLLQVGRPGEVVTSGSSQARLPEWLGMLLLGAVTLGPIGALFASCTWLFRKLLAMQASGSQVGLKERTVN